VDLLTESVFFALFGSLKWATGGGFQLTFERDRTGLSGVVWLQTDDAEEDHHGTSCPLPHVRTKDDAESLKRLILVSR